MRSNDRPAAQVGSDLRFGEAHVPASRIRRIEATLRPVLLWVRVGCAIVEAAGTSNRLTAGWALWVPKGSTLAAETLPGSVVVPIEFRTSELPDSLTQALMLRVPPGWEDWLVYRYARYLGWAYGVAPDGWSPFSFSSPSRPMRPVAAGGPVTMPPLPRSPAAREVGQLLLHGEPAVGTIVELAARVGVGTRTLQRHFVAETGLAVGQWRRCARIAAAAAYLAAGHDIGWVAHRVGYANVSAFSHAFRAHVGDSPQRYAAATAASSTAAPDHRPWPGDVVELAAAGQTTRDAPPPIPAAEPFWSVDLYELAVWLYRGAATINVSGHVFKLRRGDVMWLPAGVPNRVHVTAGSIMLPLGRRRRIRPTPAESLTVISMPTEMDDFLLHSVVSNHSWLRPERHDDTAIVETIRTIQMRTGQLPAASASSAVADVIVAFTVDPADQRSLSDFARQLDIDLNELRQAFTALTGTSFPRWRGRMRMTMARDLLWEGRPPKVVARRLGYAHLSGFNKVFKSANGLTPREFVRIESR